VIGIDEVGLAPLAGPVVACAILMPEGDLIEGVRDSKTLSRRQREQLDPIIRRAAVAWGIGAASAREVERLNPRAASHLAMQRAVRALERRHGRPVEFALVDGAPARELNDLIGAHETVVKGDASVYSIACASIVAKVLRDRLMRQLDRRYPGYGWTSNAGYPAPAHIAALDRLGVTPHHRRTYAPVADRISRAEGGR
jgi:ribonuclease HII